MRGFPFYRMAVNLKKIFQVARLILSLLQRASPPVSSATLSYTVLYKGYVPHTVLPISDFVAKMLLNPFSPDDELTRFVRYASDPVEE